MEQPSSADRALARLGKVTTLPKERVKEVFDAAVRSLLSGREEATDKVIERAVVVAFERLASEERDARVRPTRGHPPESGPADGLAGQPEELASDGRSPDLA